jgi:phage terminase large subunit-like protein
MGAAEAVAHALGFRPWLPESDPEYIVRNAKGKPIKVPNVGIIAGESFNVAIQDTLVPTLKEWIPPSLIKREVNNQARVTARMELTNGSLIKFMAYNQDPKEFEGTKYHWIWYDEPPPRNIFTASQRGLVDFAGRTWFTMTPLKEPWIWSELTSQAGINPDVFHVRWDGKENPHVDPDELEAYYRTLPPEELEARKHGRPQHLSGLVFKEWKSEKPYFVEYFDPPHDWIRIMGIDPHPRKPIACLWVAISPHTDIWYVYRELYDPDLRTVHEVCNVIEHMEAFEQIHYRVSDNSARENEKTSDTSVYEQFMTRLCADDLAPGLDLPNKTDKMGRIAMIHQMLDTRNSFSCPQLVVMDRCRRVRHEFMNYVWQDWAISRDRSERDPKPEVRKKDDDMLDILMYLRQHGVNASDFQVWEDEELEVPGRYVGGSTGYGY